MLQINNISKTYDKVKALKNISFNVDKAELFGIIGPDGAGKTSLLRIITTLLLPDSGTATLDNLDVVKDYKKLRHLIGYMPGRFSLYQDLSVEENLRFFATVFGTSIEENYDLVKHIYSHIEPFKKRLAGKLSGGMKQKLALSCALIHRPKILVLDEPTTGVDAVSRKEFWEMLKDLKKHEITIIVSTPYMDEAELCDRVALMQNGEILSIDTPQNIIESFEKEILEIRSDNLYSLIQDLRKYENTDSVFPFGQYLHFTAKIKDYDINSIVNYLENNNHTNIIINKTKANIEDCFMNLMSREENE